MCSFLVACYLEFVYSKLMQPATGRLMFCADFEHMNLAMILEYCNIYVPLWAAGK